MKNIIIKAALVAAAVFAAVSCREGEPRESTYTNPILHSDYSDPDVIRVGKDFWMTASSFTCFPGLQILHSTDLVNWEIVNAAVPSLEPASDFDSPSHGNGIWAPCIRYHKGTYWIFWGDPDHGIYQIHTKDPRGKWSKPHLILEGKGLIDTSPLWDDDGKVWLVHGWAGSRAGFKSVLSVCELSEDCTEVISDQFLVFDGKKSGNETVEGPKFYKKDGWYYIFAPSGGVKEGWQLVLRSKSILGPYEHRTVLHQGGTPIHGPHQGGWVTDTKGSEWFIHFEDRGPWGRVCHLQPLHWDDEGWCIIGEDIDGDGIGEPIAEYRLPAGKKTDTALSATETSVAFDGNTIPLNWQWEANPKFNWFMLNPGEGCLRLNCIKSPDGWRNLRDTPNILAEKIVGPETSLILQMTYRPSYPTERAGMVITGRSYFTLEAECGEDGQIKLARKNCIDADNGATEETVFEKPLGKAETLNVWLKVEINEDALCTLSYSLDGSNFEKAGEAFKAVEGKWIGAKIGIFAISGIKKNDAGSAEFRACL